MAMDVLTKPDPLVEPDHGEVFTRSWVVNLILDLVGYAPENDITTKTLVEPACGSGAFLGPIIDRLVECAQMQGSDISSLEDCVAAYDIQKANVEASRALVRERLMGFGVDGDLAQHLASAWVHHGDYLLDATPEAVDFVVGNPPYIRMESVPSERAAAYRSAHPTMAGRADIYVGFIERGLKSLALQGALGFICADRWMRNSYGTRLRTLISEEWSVDTIIKMQGVDAFEDEVDAYPAITVLSRQPQQSGPTVVRAAEDFGENGAIELAREIATGEVGDRADLGFRARKTETWSSGPGGWADCSPARLTVLSHIETSFPALGSDETGTAVGIGVATGADKIFVPKEVPDIENERLLPMALPRDIADGELKWSGRYLVNPWDKQGLVDLDGWEKFHAYLKQFEPDLAKRHTAKRGSWYRTIDRVNPDLFTTEKLYIPDFKDRLFPVLDEGTTYPHHNLYWVTSQAWDIRALGGFLLSDIANAFIEAYSVRMRGGYLRFQAQYLRRIRIPIWTSVGDVEADELREAFATRNRELASTVAKRLLGVDALPD